MRALRCRARSPSLRPARVLQCMTAIRGWGPALAKWDCFPGRLMAYDIRELGHTDGPRSEGCPVHLVRDDTAPCETSHHLGLRCPGVIEPHVPGHAPWSVPRSDEAMQAPSLSPLRRQRPESSRRRSAAAATRDEASRMAAGADARWRGFECGRAGLDTESTMGRLRQPCDGCHHEPEAPIPGTRTPPGSPLQLMRQTACPAQPVAIRTHQPHRRVQPGRVD